MIYVVILGIVAAAAAIGGIRAAQRGAARRAGVLEATSDLPHATVATLRGTVALIGEPLISPLAGVPCAAFRATGRSYKMTSMLDDTSNKLPMAPRIVAGPGLDPLGPLRPKRVLDQEKSEVRMIPFMLVSKHGEIRVDGEQCKLPDRSAPIIPRRLEREREFMGRTGLPGTVAEAGFDEVAITAGTRIIVRGTVRVAEDGTTRLVGAPIAIDFP